MEPISKYVCIYPRYYDAISMMPEEKQLETLKLIIEYGLYGKEPAGSMDKEEKKIFLLAKQDIDNRKKQIKNRSTEKEAGQSLHPKNSKKNLSQLRCCTDHSGNCEHSIKCDNHMVALRR